MSRREQWLIGQRLDELIHGLLRNSQQLGQAAVKFTPHRIDCELGESLQRFACQVLKDALALPELLCGQRFHIQYG